jgi:hypothetical protein
MLDDGAGVARPAGVEADQDTHLPRQHAQSGQAPQPVRAIDRSHSQGQGTQHGYDVFTDYDGIASGEFETIIFENIRARAHFLILLTPTALEQCGDPKDWMRREIEAATDNKRNIVPVMLKGFNFDTSATAGQLTGKLVAIKQYNGLPIPEGYFSAAMERLRDKFLNVSLDTILYTASLDAQRAAMEQKGKAEKALTDEETRQAAAQKRWRILPWISAGIAAGHEPRQRMLAAAFLW